MQKEHKTVGTTIGTAGHIDHGKTSLIKALTGTDTDRLKEEKEREITIDLGFAFLGDNIAFIDVPGHERFVKNMVAGVTGIDIALLVIAANDGIMPQTLEHLDILRLLGVSNMVVVLTKTDLVEEDWIELVSDEVGSLLEQNGYGTAPVIPVSSRTGAGIDELEALLLSKTEELSDRNMDIPFRLPVDRSFTMTGFGTVVTGTVVAGSTGLNDSVEIFPKNIKTRLRGLQSQGKQTERLHAGERGAINVGGISKDDVLRGDVIAHTGTIRASENLNCTLTYLSSAKAPLPYHGRVRFHTGTSEVIGRVAILDRDQIEPGETAPVQIQLEKPVAAAVGDRYIIRLYSPPFTIGGGEILETAALRPRKNRKFLAEYVRKMADLEQDERIFARIERSGVNPVSVTDLAREFSRYPEKVSALLEGDKRVICVNKDEGKWLKVDEFHAIVDRIHQKVDQFHTKNTTKPGMKRTDLIAQLQKKVPEPVLKLAIETLENDSNISLTKEWIRLSNFTPEVSGASAEIKEKLVNLINERGISAPSVKEAAELLEVSQDDIRAMTDILVDEGVVTVVESVMLFSTKEIERITGVLTAWCEEHESITLADFRTQLNTSRKYALPLLNYFDETGLTVRAGDERVLNR